MFEPSSMPAMNRPQKVNRVVLTLIVLLATGIFIWELMTPLGMVEWLFYVPVLLLTMWLPYRRATYTAAGAFTVLIIAGHFLSPPGGFPNLSVFNRSVGVCMVWMTAALVRVWKRTEEALQQNESTLRGFYDSASMMIGVADVEGDDIRPVSVNAATARFLGTTPEAMRNRLASDLGMPREYILKWVQHYWECVQTGGPVRFEYLRQTSGGPRWLSATICHIGGAGEGPARFAYITEDITDRKQVEEALQESEAFKNRILENSPDCIKVLDLEGRLLFMSKGGMERLEIYDDAPILNSQWVEFWKGEDKKRARAAIEAARTGGIGRFIGFCPTATGTPKWWDVFITPLLDANGAPDKLLSISRDITDRKRAEEELLGSRDQLRALSAHLQSIREEEQTRLAREVHDELGQSLTGLQLGLTWLGKKLDPQQYRLQEKVRALLAIAGATIQSVQRLSSALRPVVLDDLGLIAAMEWQARSFEGHTGIQCAFSSSIEKIDLDQMRATTVFRILQESLTNVARHAGATKVTVAFTQMERLLALVIQDNGKGIAENVISDPRSLGLIGMQERAHACGGNVTVSCPPSGGTVVTARIQLPRAEQA